MARLLILIIALNAFSVPTLAMGNCEMMDAVETSHNSMEMDCSECEESVCSTTQCGINSPVYTAAVLFSEKHSLVIVAGNHQPQADLAYFYKIVLPINTPPPLV